MTTLPKHKGSLAKFIIFSLIGILIFFIPIASDGSALIVLLISRIKALLGIRAQYLAFIVSAPLCVTFILSKVTDNKALKDFHAKDGNLYGMLYFLAFVFSLMVFFQVGPQVIIEKNVGQLALSIASSVLLTTFIAGWLAIFLMKSGIVDFIGVLLEPLMRPLFKLPGEAAVNAVTAFVSAPAVGVYFTNKLYKDRVYTQKEVIAVMTNFSVCSIGFFAVLVSIAGITNLYSQVILASIIVTFIMGIIVIRIPIISNKKNLYIDGTEQTKESLKADKVSLGFVRRFNKALEMGIAKSGEITLESLGQNLVGAAKFTQKIVAFVIAVSTISLLLAQHTVLFNILGMPMELYLNLLRIPDAALIAPSTVIGITELTLPVLITQGLDISQASIFFVTVLSTVQVIFFTGSATAMLELDVPLKPYELVIIFLIRTIIAIPIVYLITILFGI